MTAPSDCRALITELFLPGTAAMSSVTVGAPLAMAASSNSRSCLPIWECFGEAGAAEAADGTDMPAATSAPRAVRATVARRTLGVRKICMQQPLIVARNAKKSGICCAINSQEILQV